MSFMLAEDEALKAHLSGITVSDQRKQNRAVRIWFRRPQKELTEATYPFITINLVGMMIAREREMRGGFSTVGLGYTPWWYTPDGEETTINGAPELPTPVDLIYRVDTHARNPLHDRVLQGQMILPQYLPFRFGSLTVDDNTLRRLDLLGVDVNDYSDSSSEHVFSKTYSVRVSSELPTSTLVEYQKVTTVDIGLSPTEHTPELDPAFTDIDLSI